MRKGLTIAGFAFIAASAAVMGCSNDRTVVRRETVETVPSAPIVERRTQIHVPPPVEETTTTYQSGTVEQRTHSIETIE
jgi:hypothetical protein